MEEVMTGIERHFKEVRQARLAEFRRRLTALREEFSDIDLIWVDPIGDSIAEIYEYHPGQIIEVRKPTRRTWSWG